MSSAAPPDHMDLALPAGTTVLKGRSPISSPGHFIDAFGSLDSFDAETLPKLSALDVLDERPNGGLEGFAFFLGQFIVIAPEPRHSLIGRHEQLALSFQRALEGRGTLVAVATAGCDLC